MNLPTQNSFTADQEPKHIALRRALLEVIQRSAPNTPLPSYSQIVREYGVVQTTIDRVWRELEADGLIVRKHGKGIFVSPRAKQINIGLVFGVNVFGTAISPFYGTLLQRCQQRTQTHNEHFSFYLDLPTTQLGGVSFPAHRDLVEDIEASKLHGILLVSRHSEEQENWLRQQNIPVVAFAPEMRTKDVVGIDYGELVRLGVESLAAQGCKRIALMTGLGHARSHTPPFREDTQAYEKTLRRLGLECRPEWIWEPDAPIERKKGGAWIEDGRQGMRALLEGSRDTVPDGIVITDDIMTDGALLAAQKMKLVVGREIRIASHSNKESPILHRYDEFLTLIEIDTDDIVEAMFNMLEGQISGRKQNKRTVLVKPKVHVRGDD